MVFICPCNIDLKVICSMMMMHDAMFCLESSHFLTSRRDESVFINIFHQPNLSNLNVIFLLVSVLLQLRRQLRCLLQAFPPVPHQLLLSPLWTKIMNKLLFFFCGSAIKIYIVFVIRSYSLISSCRAIRPLLLSLKSSWASLYFVITSTNFLARMPC